MATVTEEKSASEEFFNKVRREPVLVNALRQSEIDIVDVGPSQHNSVFTLTKRDWSLPRLQGQARTLNVHFEARNKNEFRLEVGLDPYEGNIELKPDLFAHLAPTLERKSRLLSMLRLALHESGVVSLPIKTNVKRLLAPEKTRSHTIVKFTTFQSMPVSPGEFAQFCATVIADVAPVVERILEKLKDFEGSKR